MLGVTREKAVRRRSRHLRIVAAAVAALVVVSVLALASRSDKTRHQVTVSSETTTPTTATTRATTTEATTSTAAAAVTTPPTSPTTTTIEHREAAPGLKLEIAVTPATTTTGSTVGLDVHATDDLGQVYSVMLGWGDDSQGGGFGMMPSCAPGHRDGDPQPTTFDHHDDHVYDATGAFTITVTVHSRLFCDERYDEFQTEEEATQSFVITIV
jgi:hypothetical protein